MPKKEKPEIIEGDAELRLNLFILAALYVLVGLLINPLIDWLLNQGAGGDAAALQAMVRRKEMAGLAVHAAWRAVPVLYMFWFGFRIYASARLPPGGMKRFPFTVVCIRGRTAKMFGLVLMVVCTGLLARELVALVRAALGTG